MKKIESLCVQALGVYEEVLAAQPDRYANLLEFAKTSLAMHTSCTAKATRPRSPASAASRMERANHRTAASDGIGEMPSSDSLIATRASLTRAASLW